MGGINSNMENFLKMRNKTILCFGAGSYFRVMYHDFKDRDPDFKVAGIIDNNVDKLGKTIKILSDSIPVFSVDFVCQHFKPQTVVIFITTAFHQEVMEQLKRITFFQDVEIYSYYEIKKNNTEDYTALEVSLSEPVIPKKIHYCWFGGKPMPVHLQRQVESWRNFCRIMNLSVGMKQIMMYIRIHIRQMRIRISGGLIYLIMFVWMWFIPMAAYTWIRM